MRVVATQRGYYRQLIEEGQLFELDKEADFSDRWMRKFDTDADKGAPQVRQRRKKRKPVVIEEPETFSDITENSAEQGWE